MIKITKQNNNNNDGKTMMILRGLLFETTLIQSTS